MQEAGKQYKLELDTISKNGRLSDSAKAEQRKKADDKLDKIAAEIEERCKLAEINARKNYADLIIERDTAKAELDRIYPLAAVYHKIDDIKRLKKDIQATIDKKFENDEQRKKLRSDLLSFQFRKLAKDTNWYAEKEKAWYSFQDQVEKTSIAKAEYEAAHTISVHSEKIWKKSSAEFDIINKYIGANNERVHQLGREKDRLQEDLNQLQKEQKQLQEELKTSSASTNADTIAAIQTKEDAIQAKKDAIQTNKDSISKIETQTIDLTKRKADVISDIEKYQEEFHKHEEISTEKKLALSHEESALAIKDSNYKLVNERAKSEDERETRHADRLRDKEKQQEAFQMLRAIQRSNNRAMILSQALGQSSSAINAHAIGGLQAMLAALQK